MAVALERRLCDPSGHFSERARLLGARGRGVTRPRLRQPGLGPGRPTSGAQEDAVRRRGLVGRRVAPLARRRRPRKVRPGRVLAGARQGVGVETARRSLGRASAGSPGDVVRPNLRDAPPQAFQDTILDCILPALLLSPLSAVVFRSSSRLPLPRMASAPFDRLHRCMRTASMEGRACHGQGVAGARRPLRLGSQGHALGVAMPRLLEAHPRDRELDGGALIHGWQRCQEGSEVACYMADLRPAKSGVRHDRRLYGSAADTVRAPRHGPAGGGGVPAAHHFYW